MHVVFELMIINSVKWQRNPMEETLAKTYVLIDYIQLYAGIGKLKFAVNKNFDDW